MNKFLIKSGNLYYTVVDQVLTALEIVDLVAEDFITHGMEQIPDYAIYASLENPQFCVWNSANLTSVKANIQAKPFIQIIEPMSFDILPPNMTNINRVSNATVSASGVVEFSIAFGDTVQKVFDGTAWIAYDSTNGMSVDVLQGLTVDQWELLIPARTPGTVEIRAYLGDTGQLKNLVMNFENTEV